MKKKLVVIGAGPKALNILAKCEALKKNGWKVPEIVVIEKSEVGAYWTGKHGYTDGNGILGSPPFKTFDYPASSIFGASVAQEMKKYSFSNYLISHNKFEKWVDSGTPWINHAEFAQYLKWIGKHFADHILYGNVTNISHRGRKWLITYETNGETKSILADGLVPTGPGETKNPFGIDIDHMSVFEGKFWWNHKEAFENYQGNIALIGGGIAAGSIFETLAPKLAEGSKIDWFTQRGLFTRSENFANNQRFSHPDLWQQIPLEARKRFMKSTDRGSIDPATHLVMQKHHVSFQEVISEIYRVDRKNGKIQILFADGIQDKIRMYDRVIICTGFNTKSIFNIFSPDMRQILPLNSLENKILPDLSLEHWTPKLQLPMLSYIKVALGIATLGSPSAMSDRVLSTWVEKPNEVTANQPAGLEVRQGLGKGDSLFALQRFKKSEVVVQGFPVTFSLSRTQTSVQIGIDMHMEPSHWFVKANNSCNPNCGIVANDLGGYSLVALRDISSKEEITWDYATTEWESIALQNKKCLCGEPDCRGIIGGYKKLSPALRDKYKNFHAPYLELYL